MHQTATFGAIAWQSWWQYLLHHGGYLFDAIVAFVFISLILTVVILISRAIKSVRSARVARFKHRIAPLLGRLLFEENEFDKIKKRLERQYMTDQLARRVLLGEIVQLHNNFTGEAAQKLEDLYQCTGLVVDSYLKLQKRPWHQKAQGIYELAAMHQTAAVAFLIPFTRHANQYVRLEAQHALIKLGAENPFHFLSSYPYQLTDWEQMRLAEALARQPLEQVPLFTNWLTEQNTSVLVFALRMCKQYTQYEAKDFLPGLLRHSHQCVRSATIEVLQALGAEELLPQLQANFAQEAAETQVLIIQTVEELGGQAHIVWLEQLYQGGESQVALAAGQAIIYLTNNRESLRELGDSEVQRRVREHLSENYS